MAENQQPTTGVLHGDRQRVRYEPDPDQVVRVRHVFPTDEAPRNSQQHTGASETTHPPAMPTPEAEREAAEPSAWEAVEPGVDPSDRGD